MQDRLPDAASQPLHKFTRRYCRHALAAAFCLAAPLAVGAPSCDSGNEYRSRANSAQGGLAKSLAGLPVQRICFMRSCGNLSAAWQYLLSPLPPTKHGETTATKYAIGSDKSRDEIRRPRRSRILIAEKVVSVAPGGVPATAAPGSLAVPGAISDSANRPSEAGEPTAPRFGGSFDNHVRALRAWGSPFFISHELFRSNVTRCPNR